MGRLMNRYIALILSLVLFPLSFQVNAAKYALLVGVSEYESANIGRLEGPEYDLPAVRDALIKHWGFKSSNVTSLMGRDASRGKILNQLDSLKAKGKPGDHLFLYFSGHGTSAANRKLSVPLAHSTGAFLPWDTKFDKQCISRGGNACTQQFLHSVLIGNRDIKPRLKKLEQTFQVTYVNDSCFAGNAVRSLQANSSTKLRLRAVNLSISEEDSDYSGCGYECSGEKVAQYPYKKVFSLAASGHNQPASDISRDRLKYWPTLDNKPHGAFTDAFLRVLKGELNADQNGDNSLTNGEVLDTIRLFMLDRKYSHSPASLPSHAENASLYARNFLGQGRQSSLKEHADSAVQSSDFVVNATKLSPSQIKRLKQAGFKMVSGPVTGNGLSVAPYKSQTSSYMLLDPSGGIVASDLSSVDELIESIRVYQMAETWAIKLGKAAAPLKAFPALKNAPNVSSTLIPNDQLYFSLLPDAESHLLIFDLMPDGNIVVLYPATQAERLKRFSKGKISKVFHSQSELIVVTPPYGRDSIHLYTFNKWPKALEGILAKSGMSVFNAHSEKANQLFQLLNDKNVSKSGQRIILFTEPGK